RADVAPKSVESCGDGLLPGITACDDAPELRTVASGREHLGLGIALAPCGRDDDDLSRRRREHTVERMPQHRTLVDADEGFRRRSTEARTRTGSNDDDRRRRHRNKNHALTLARAVSVSGSKNLVEDHASRVFVALLCERELGDENLTSLGKH